MTPTTMQQTLQKLTARLQRPTLVEALGRVTVRMIPHAGDSERTPLPNRAVERPADVRRVQSKRKVRVAVGPLLISERAWDRLQAGATVKVWYGPRGKESMHYCSLVNWQL